MATVAVTRVAGLHTSGNELASPEGALIKADNCIIRSPNTIESRRGQEILTYTFGTGAVPDELIFFSGTLLVHGRDETLHYDTGSAFTSLSSNLWELPGTSPIMRLKTAEAAQSLYLATDAGVQVMETPTTTQYNAGIYRAPDAQVVAVSAGTGSWAWSNNSGSTVAYYVVWGRKDAHGRFLLGAPSGRTIATNTSAADRFVELRIPAVTQSDASSFFRVYRTESTPDTTTTPPADAYQVAEAYGGNFLSFPIGSMSKAAGTSAVTITVNNHGWRAGTRFEISGSGEAAFPNGVYSASSVTTNTIVYSDGVVSVPGAVNAAAHSSFPISFRVYDYTPEIMLTDPLYTNPTDGEGILAANDMPPRAADIAHWRERLWFADTNRGPGQQLQLLGVGAPDGIQTGDTITIGSQTYTARAVVTVPASEFLIVTSGSAAQNIENTIRNLVTLIADNVWSSEVQAAYLSGDNDPPGKFLIYNGFPDAAALTITSSRPASWSPYLSSVVADTEDKPNRLYYSKPGQPEAVPLLNYMPVGAENSSIWRIVPLRDKLYVFKERGYYTVTGAYPFRLDLADETIRFLSPDTIKAAGNQVFALTDQGLVSISDAGAGIVSGPFDEDLLYAALGPNNANIKRYSFATVYESEHTYWLHLASSTTYGTEAYVYNYLRNTWTRAPISRTCGLVSPVNDKLYMGHATSNSIWRERKAFTNADYRDETYSKTVTVITGSDTTYSATLSSVTSVAVGDSIEAAGWRGTITAINGSVLTVSGFTGTAATGVVTISKAIPCSLTWVAQDAGSPTVVKHYRTAHLLFRRKLFYTGKMTFAAEHSQTLEAVDIVFSDRAFAVGTALSTRSFPISKMVLVPKEKQRACYLQVGFNITEAYSAWQLNGYGLDFEGVSEKGNR